MWTSSEEWSRREKPPLWVMVIPFPDLRPLSMRMWLSWLEFRVVLRIVRATVVETFETVVRNSGRRLGRHAAIKYILGSMILHIASFATTQVPSVLIDLASKKIAKRTIEATTPLAV
jgi:hypothetical protein